MRTLRISLVVALLVLPHAAMAARVVTDHDRAADFGRYRTYGWTEGTPVPNGLVHDRIVRAVETQLAAKGLARDEESPDLLVSYHASARDELRVSTFDWGPRRWRRTEVDVYTVRVGTLVVDMSDARTRKTVWRSEATDSVVEDPERMERRINKVTERMFRDYPPKPR